MPSGEHPFDGDMILIKNKNKNNTTNIYLSASPPPSLLVAVVSMFCGCCG